MQDIVFSCYDKISGAQINCTNEFNTGAQNGNSIIYYSLKTHFGRINPKYEVKLAREANNNTPSIFIKPLCERS